MFINTNCYQISIHHIKLEEVAINPRGLLQTGYATYHKPLFLFESAGCIFTDATFALTYDRPFHLARGKII